MNKYARVKTVLEGGLPDRTPVGFWYHNPSNYTTKQHIDAQYALYRDADLDVVKLMYDFGYSLECQIQKASDWRKIRPEKMTALYFQRYQNVLEGILEKVQGDCMVWVTLFGPLKMATISETDAKVMRHLREDPAAVLAGVTAIADTMQTWVNRFFEIGADALYYSAQFGEPGRFDIEEWEMFVRPFDLKMLDAVKNQRNKYAVLHLCGEPEYDYRVNLQQYEDYPGNIVNWAVHANQFDLEQGKKLFKRPILGGLDNRGVMANGSIDAVQAATKEIIQTQDKAGFFLGADCSLTGPECLPRIKAAVEMVRRIEI